MVVLPPDNGEDLTHFLRWITDHPLKPVPLDEWSKLPQCTHEGFLVHLGDGVYAVTLKGQFLLERRDREQDWLATWVPLDNGGQAFVTPLGVPQRHLTYDDLRRVVRATEALRAHGPEAIEQEILTPQAPSDASEQALLYEEQILQLKQELDALRNIDRSQTRVIQAQAQLIAKLTAEAELW